jgi:hypothetical protein
MTSRRGVKIRLLRALLWPSPEYLRSVRAIERRSEATAYYVRQGLHFMARRLLNLPGRRTPGLEPD